MTILLKELEADCAVARDAGRKAALRIGQESPGHLEACAYELARFYNILEKMLERICDAFEIDACCDGFCFKNPLNPFNPWLIKSLKNAQPSIVLVTHRL